MAARVVKIRHDDETRAKIQTSQLINRLQDHVFGKVDLVSTQVQSALGLLKKTLPDMTEAKITHIKQEATDYTRAELVAILAEPDPENGSTGIAAPDGSGREPDSIH